MPLGISPTVDDLRRLLPEPAYTKATGVLEMISRTPELRTPYDDRVKESKDRYSEMKDAVTEAEARGKEAGKLEGKAEGKVEGKVDQIRMLERLLGEPARESEDLLSMPYDSLTQLASELEQRFLDRS